METNTTTNAKNMFNLQIMGFHGFYYSYFDSDNRYNAMLSEKEYYESEYETDIDIDDIVFDDERYQNDVIKNFADEWNYGMGELVKSVSNVTMKSPRFYNYETDKIYADIELADNWEDILRKFMTDNYDALKKRIDDDWSDRSGFWSFIDSDIVDWVSYLFDEDLFDARYLQIMLAYYYEFNNGVDNALDRLNEIVSQNVEMWEYTELSDKGWEKIEAKKLSEK